MKKLLLNFLFFVGAALVFIQCAMLFPTADKQQGSALTGNLNAGNVIFAKQNKIPITSSNAVGFNFGTKSQLSWPFATNTAFPYQMMLYINRYPLFYNPYINFTYSNFVNKYRRVSKHVKNRFALSTN